MSKFVHFGDFAIPGNESMLLGSSANFQGSDG
jgi:hypothetical protein